MKHINRYALTLTSAALLCGAVAAQERAAPSAQQSVAQARPLKAGDVQVSNLIGATVKNTSGQTIGEVEDLIVSSAANVTSAVISTGGVLGVGAKQIAIPYKEFTIDPDGRTLYLSLTEEQLQSRPAFDADADDDRAAANRTVVDERAATNRTVDRTPTAAPTEPRAGAPAPARSTASASDKPAATAARPANAPAKADNARTLKASEQPAKALIGAQVVDTQDTRIGKIQDLIVSAGRQGVQAILSVGGGVLSSRLVAVPLDDLTIKPDTDGDRRHEPDRVQTRLTVAQLEALPEFRYE
jgi:sporulation protein YlmC with PRC-barrel domain